jgi:hypothetical protein
MRAKERDTLFAHEAVGEKSLFPLASVENFWKELGKINR